MYAPTGQAVISRPVNGSAQNSPVWTHPLVIAQASSAAPIGGLARGLARRLGHVPSPVALSHPLVAPKSPQTGNGRSGAAGGAGLWTVTGREAQR
jgi:hypothetical protein